MTMSLMLHNPAAYIQSDELAMLRRLLPWDGAQVLELGCGRAYITRRLAEGFPIASLVATEVDTIQLEKNLAITDLPNVRFMHGGMEAIPLADASVDIAIMLKSLHHVPKHLLAPGFAEVQRVLRPGGWLYISEPVYAGDFNAILSLFNNEQQVRQDAFAALRHAVDQGLFLHRGQHFFEAPGQYPDWESFEDRMLKVTHTDHDISPELYQTIKTAFMAHLGPDGAFFLKPSRIDLLQKA
jgi:SAM-dependent methyltransferase